MVREERGPYGDPQHPYLYEEDDVWMAPGFINQFYEVKLSLDSRFFPRHEKRGNKYVCFAGSRLLEDICARS